MFGPENEGLQLDEAQRTRALCTMYVVWKRLVVDL